MLQARFCYLEDCSDNSPAGTIAGSLGRKDCFKQGSNQFDYFIFYSLIRIAEQIQVGIDCGKTFIFPC